MFVRKKANRSGSISVQVISKSGGYHVVKTIGSAHDPEEIDRLAALGERFIARQDPQYALFPENHHDGMVVRQFVEQLANTSIRTLGPELIFGRLFDAIGFDAIPEPLFKDIVVARLVYPTSKLKTVDYLYRYRGKVLSPDSIYLFLDRLNERYRHQAHQIAYRHTRRRLGSVSVVFYDMTSLYFEAEDEDDLRKIGFSKDGKFQHPQIMLGLLVGRGGWPVGYRIYEGNTFEGKTLLPALEEMAEQYDVGRPVVVADAAMLSKKNLAALDEAAYPYVVAARIRNETDVLQREILERCQRLQDGQCIEFDHHPGRRLIVSYSDKRARKDAHNRKRGLARLRKRVHSGRLTKQQLNNRGYNKFLKLTGEVSIEIDEAKIEHAARWDGLKGYLTNTGLSTREILDNYSQLWRIERAFRISKTDLRIRPMYHYRRRRIEAHILVAFVAYTIHRELEHRLAEAHIDMSPKRAAELTETMYELTFQLPHDPHEHRQLLKMDPDQQRLYDLLH